MLRSVALVRRLVWTFRSGVRVLSAKQPPYDEITSKSGPSLSAKAPGHDELEVPSSARTMSANPSSTGRDEPEQPSKARSMSANASPTGRDELELPSSARPLSNNPSSTNRDELEVSSSGVRTLSAKRAPNVYKPRVPPPRDSPQFDELDLNFNNPQISYKSKYTSELVRAYLVYTLCSSTWIVDNNDRIMKVMKKFLGKYIFEFIMRATFYGQFVAGEDTKKIQPIVNRMMSFGVKSILDYSVEEDLTHDEAAQRENSSMVPLSGKPKDSEDDAPLKQYQVNKEFLGRRYKARSVRTYYYKNEAACEKNLEYFLSSINAVHSATKSTGFMAVKMTALGRPQLLLQLSEVITRGRQFMSQLIGAEDGKVTSQKKTMEDLKKFFGEHKDKPEVQEFLNHITSDNIGIVHLFPWPNILDKDLKLSQSFRLPDAKTGRMRRLISHLSEEEENMFRNMLRRLNTVIQVAERVDVRVMIDAEQTYFQPAISRITLELMRRYNKNKYVVFNTYQAYLKNTFNEIVTDLEQAQRQDFFWGAKIVRGAYMEQERARAAAMGYEDPICATYEDTNKSYNSCLTEVLKRATSDMRGRAGVMVASHNEDSVRYAVKMMKEMDITPEMKVVCFGQLLGMCDHITFPLGQAGYSAYKYVPYGPIAEVLPYLSRRATENRGLLPKTKKEKRMILKEIIRRIVTLQMFKKPVGKYNPA